MDAKDNTKWSLDKLKEMERWKNQNDASCREVAEHFKVEPGPYATARYYHLQGGKASKPSYNKKAKAKAKKEKSKSLVAANVVRQKYNRKPAPIRLEVMDAQPMPSATKEPSVAIMVTSLGTAKDLLRSLWQ